MNPWLVLLALVALALVGVVTPVALAAYQQWRRPWRLTCPRVGTLAQIRVGAGRAAVAELFGRQPEVERCSLWPARLGCLDECLALPVGARQRMRRGETPPREATPGAPRVIVVPLDGTRGSEEVLPAVAGLAERWSATVRLLRVMPPVKELRDGEDHVIAFVDQETARVETEARDYLRRVAAVLPGVAVEDAVRIGDVVTEVVEESEAAGADLIVLAVQRRRGLARMLGNGMTRRLRRATTIPLLVVPYPEPVAA
jgi:nucleotide-binding universal stress UspA family protein